MSKFKNKKTIKTIIWLTILTVIVLSIFFIIKNKDTIFHSISNNSTIYTQQQLDAEKDKAYNQGYIDAHTNNAELKKQVEEYLNTIAERDKTIIERESTIEQNNKTIEANNKTIAEKEAEIDRLKNLATETNQSHAEAIAELQTEINSLQLINKNLQNDNTSNLELITELNQEKAELETRVTSLFAQIATNEQLIAEYEANKNAWLNSIAYYEQFIASLETETQAVAIFEVNGSIYKAQIVTKGTTATVSAPADTETTSFIGWYVDDVLVEDISSYPITTNTKFTAKFTSEFNVNFIVDNETFSTIKVAKNGYATELTTLPVKDGYDFDGWTINGIDIVDYTTYPITQNTTFTAKFTKLHTVTFIAGDEVIATQKVRNGEFAEEIDASIFAKDKYIFEGITLNGIDVVDYKTYAITADITFVAKLTKAHTVTYVLNGETISTEVVKDGSSPIGIDIQELKTWLLNNEKITLNNYIVNNDITLVAVTRTPGLFNENSEIIMSWDELKENGYITIANGVLTKAETTLTGKLFLSTEIIEIGKNAFENCTGLTFIFFPSSVKRINDYSFKDCTGLTSLYFYSNLKMNLNVRPIYGCSNLEYIYTNSFKSYLYWSGDFAIFGSSKYPRVKPNYTEEQYFKEVNVKELTNLEIQTTTTIFNLELYALPIDKKSVVA